MPRLRELQLKNFRCFKNHTMPLKDRTIIIGPNNAGKSSTVEALRLISWAIERCRSSNYETTPIQLLGAAKPGKCFRISQELLGKSKQGIYYRYEGPPAVITGTFSTGESVRVFVVEDGVIWCQITQASGEVVVSRKQASQLEIPQIQTLPQVAPLLTKESLIQPDRVRSHLSSPLAPHHFRNQLSLLSEHWEEFKKAAESTWPGLQIVSLEKPSYTDSDGHIDLQIRDRDFVREVGFMGHGLQMWLQIAWFLARTPSGAPVVLDEPDVYLHADLQRKLYRILRSRESQVIIATHSVEVLAEAEPKEVLIISRDLAKSRFSAGTPELQSVVDRLGGIQNLQMARIWSMRRCVAVEGDDLDLLSLIQKTINPHLENPMGSLPRLKLGGASNWREILGAAKILNSGVKEGDGLIKVYCILDRDHRTREEIDGLYVDAVEAGVNLHVWERCELENYLCHPTPVLRGILRKVPAAKIDGQQIVAQFMTITDSLKDSVVDAVSHHHHNLNKSKSIGFSNQYARDLVAANWASLEARLRIVPGKEILARLNIWLQSKGYPGLSTRDLARSVGRDCLATELLNLLDTIENGNEGPKHFLGGWGGPNDGSHIP